MGINNKSSATDTSTTEYVVWCLPSTSTDFCTLTKNFTGTVMMGPAYSKLCFNGDIIYCQGGADKRAPENSNCIFIPTGTTLGNTCGGIMLWGCLTT